MTYEPKIDRIEDDGSRTQMTLVEREEIDQLRAALKVREPVRWFAEQMERKLAEHDDRPGWRGNTLESLLARLDEESNELTCAVYNRQPLDEVIREAADVANFAMMIADNARRALDALNKHAAANLRSGG